MRQVEMVERNYNCAPPFPAVLWIENVEWKKTQIEKKQQTKSKSIKVKLLCTADSKERSPPGAIFPGFFRNLNDKRAHISEKRWTSLDTVLFRLVAIFRKTLLKLFHDGVHYHIETSPLFCGANQWTGFYTITTSVMKELIWSFCINKYRFTLFHSTHRDNKQ